MLPKRQARCDTDTLVWEYLDGQTTPSRLAALQARLTARKADREKFVDSSLLHGMLAEYFSAQRGEEAGAPEVDEQIQAPADIPCVAEQEPPRRKRRVKRSAA